VEFQVHIPFVEALGFELLRFANGEAEIAMTPREEHMNSWSVVHGGVTMTLLDVAMAHAARSPVDGSHRPLGWSLPLLRLLCWQVRRCLPRAEPRRTRR